MFYLEGEAQPSGTDCSKSSFSANCMEKTKGTSLFSSCCNRKRIYLLFLKFKVVKGLSIQEFGKGTREVG